MVTIAASPDEVRAGQLSASHHREAVNALKQVGLVVLDGVIDLEHVEALRVKMLDDVAAILARPDQPFNWVVGHLQQDPPPFPPYLFKDVLLNPLVTHVTRTILGDGLKNTYYSGNTNLPGSPEQPVHADMGQLWPDLEVAHPAYALVVNVPVVDIDESNGSTELWPGSHLDTSVYVQQGDIKVPAESLERRRAIAPPLQPVVRRGGVLIRDARLWHRGMPNRSDRPRPMIAMIHCVSWWPADTITFPAGTEAFFQGSDLHTSAVFVDGPIDHIGHPEAYDYRP